MSHTPTPKMGKRPGTEADGLAAPDDVESLLKALEDGDCREILAATSEETLSASELSERCQLPLSTTYRKVALLTEAGLLEEQIRLSTSGKHTSEYALGVEDIHLSLGAEGGLEFEITRCTGGENASQVLAGAD